MARWRWPLLLALYLITLFGSVLVVAWLEKARQPESAPGPVLVAMTKPFKDASMFQGQYTFIDERGLYYFVIDVESGELYGIRDLCFRKRSEPAPAGSYACQIHTVSWLDNETLRVEVSEPHGIRFPDEAVDNAVFHLDLSGKVRRTIERPLRLQTAPMQWSWSADGRWMFRGETPPPDESTLVLSMNAPNRYNITSAPPETAKWSPTESKLALLGNYCTDRQYEQRFDLFIFDAVKGRLINLTEDLSDNIVFYEWNPNGKSIAATGLHFGDSLEPNKILLLDPEGLEPPRTMLNLGPLGAFTPAGWNPDGSRLLVKFFGGAGWCTGLPRSTPPTRLEVR